MAKGPSTDKVVKPLFFLLTKQEFGSDGQHSALHILCRADYTLNFHHVIEPFIPLIDSQKV